MAEILGEGDFVGGESDARGAEFSDWEFWLLSKTFDGLV